MEHRLWWRWRIPFFTSAPQWPRVELLTGGREWVGGWGGWGQQLWSRERRFHLGRGSGVTDTDAAESLRRAPGMPYGAWLLPVLPLCTPVFPLSHLLHHASHPLSWFGIHLFDWFNLLAPGGHRFRVWWWLMYPIPFPDVGSVDLVVRSSYHLLIAFVLMNTDQWLCLHLLLLVCLLFSSCNLVYVMLWPYLCQAAKAPIIRSSWSFAPIPSNLFNLKSAGERG